MSASTDGPPGAEPTRQRRAVISVALTVVLGAVVAVGILRAEGGVDGAASGADGGGRHLTAHRKTITIDSEAPGRPEEMVAVFVLEPTSGWRIFASSADVRARPEGPPLWTMGMVLPADGRLGSVVRGAQTASIARGWITRRLEVRVPPTGGAKVLCTNLAPASSLDHETNRPVPVRRECVSIPDR